MTLDIIDDKLGAMRLEAQFKVRIFKIPDRRIYPEAEKSLFGSRYNSTASAGMTTLLLSPLKSQVKNVLSLLIRSFLWPPFTLLSAKQIISVITLGGEVVRHHIDRLVQITTAWIPTTQTVKKTQTHLHCLIKRHTGFHSITVITIDLHNPNNLLPG